MATPLTDSINALTTYANEVTGQSDTNLSDAVHTLASGYGQGYSIKDMAIKGANLLENQDLDLNGVVNVASFAFNDCLFNKVYSDTVKTIGIRAFGASANAGARNILIDFDFPNLEETKDYPFGYRKFLKTDIVCTAIKVGTSFAEGSANVTSIKYTRADSIASDQVYGCGTAIKIIINSTPTKIANNAFRNANNLADIYVPWSEGAVADAPWGATTATIHYDTVFDTNGDPII